MALSYLEEAIGETCRQGMLHFTPAVVAGLQAFPLEGGADGRLLTANGTPLVSGDGYIGIGATGGLPAAGAGESWAFATGRVEVHLGPVVTHHARREPGSLGQRRDVQSGALRACDLGRNR